MSRRLSRRQRRLNAALSTLLLLGICVQANRLADEHLAVRRDFSEDQLYGLSSATVDLLAGLDDVLVLEAYLTGEAEHASAQVAKGRLLDLMRELRTAAGDRLEVRLYDPNADTPARLEAERLQIRPYPIYGVQGTATVRQDLYLGFVLRHRGREEVLQFALPQHFEQRFSSALRKLTREEPRVVGFTTGADFTSARDRVALQHRVVEVGGLAEGMPVPGEVELLIVMRPAGLHPRAAFEIDQFVQRGGKLLLLLDRVDTVPRAGVASAVDPGLDEMLGAWGVEVGTGHVFELSDGAVLPVEYVDASGTRRSVEYPYHLLVGQDRMAREHPVTSAQPAIGMYWTHPIDVAGVPEDVEVTVLARSTGRSYHVPALTSLVLDTDELNAQAAELLANGTPRSFPVAVALQGPLPSAFAAGAPAPRDPIEAALHEEARRRAVERGEDPPPDLPATTDEPVMSAQSDAQVVVMGDSDWASDRGGFLGAESVMLLANLVDWMVLEHELMALNSRIPRDRSIRDFVREEREARDLVNLAGVDPTQVREPHLETDAARAAARRRWIHMGAALLGSALLLGVFFGVGRALNRVGGVA